MANKPASSPVNNRTFTRLPLRVTTGVFIVVGLLTALVGTANAWSASPSGAFECVVTDDGFELGLTWTVVSWEPDDLMGENPSVVLEMSRDGGPTEVLATGAFTPENGGQFGGSVLIPEGPGSLTLTARADAPWGDGTVDSSETSVALTVPTIEELNDPECQPEPTVTPTVEPTPQETPEAVVTPEAVPTPSPEVAGEVVAQTPTEEPAETPEVDESQDETTPEEATPGPEVESNELAQTGADIAALLILAASLIGVGALVYWGRRPSLER